jgi:putative oxidoreductase
MDVGLLVLRAAAGLLLAGHGLQKLLGAFGGSGVKGTTETMARLGLHPPRLNALAAAWAETLGGGLIALGLVTPVGAMLVIAVMVTAALTAHAGNGVWATNGGYELPLTNAAIAFAIAAIGPGSVSLDNALGVGMTGIGWGILALWAGIAGSTGAIALGRSVAHRRRGRSGRPITAAR